MPVQARTAAQAMLEAVPHWSKLCREDEVLLFRAGERWLPAALTCVPWTARSFG